MSARDYQMKHLVCSKEEIALVEAINNSLEGDSKLPSDFICVRPLNSKGFFTLSRYTNFEWLIEYQMVVRKYYADIEDETISHDIEIVELDPLTGYRKPTVTRRFSCDKIMSCVNDYIRSHSYRTHLE